MESEDIKGENHTHDSRLPKKESGLDSFLDDLENDEGCLLQGCLVISAPLTAGVAGLGYGLYEAARYFIN